MYKVFVNDKPIILTDSLKKSNFFLSYPFGEKSIETLFLRLKDNAVAGIILQSNNLEKDWKTFQSFFKVRCAAGGLVINNRKEILFIYREEKWDLPKGGVEKGETIEQAAVREVQEECGVGSLKIFQSLLKTYHIFFRDNQQQLKKTDWFLMQTSFVEKLTPQLEEGITEVVFKSPRETQQALKNSYANIQLVYKKYQELLDNNALIYT